ncbi:MAG: EamA family transporter [Gaiellales bacterium]
MTTRAPSYFPIFIFALLVTWLVWGSSFVAIRYALDGLPPLLLMASRYVTAGAIATAIGLVLSKRAGHARLCWRTWRDAALIGSCFIAIGMGAIGWASTRLPTGIAALLVASAPLWVALLQMAFVRDRGSSRIGLLGLGFGLIGVALLVMPNGSGPSIDVTAAIVLVAANAAWAGATLFAPKATVPKSLILEVGMQMLLGGVILMAIAFGSGEGARFEASAVTMSVAGSWLYLVLPAAIGTFLCYGWLLRHTSAGTAASHAFINPLVAVALGALLLGEHIGARLVLAGGTIILAVVLLMVGEARVTAAATAAASGAAANRAPRVRRPRRVRGYGSAGRASRALSIRRPMRTGAGWSPAPTPTFAARRMARPSRATDGMDALAIDEALDTFG